MRVLPVLGIAPLNGRSAAEASAAREAELARAGWVRRSVAEPPRLDEIVALYRELGYDVQLESVAGRLLDSDCHQCAPALAASRVVYTRKP